MNITTTSFSIGDKVDFILEDKHNIVGTVKSIGTYYKQIDPATNKVTAKFGYSDRIINRMVENGTIKKALFMDNKAYLDEDVYFAIDNAIEVELDKPLFYNGIEIERWTFKEGFIVKNTTK